ncbi:tripartite tricarboxylate transporter substrate binding protein [Polynucleobacter sp. AP-Nino-20-G2]|uniref:tripartite tricarboxylate transporter substrate binding protein n=1 Tax=Polynucleobacter sp. AP-Nino-20-G2 TaxID=2576917 RepID=UPI001BFECC1A|nr:tripartite tricarboxylate transporter substrate binding protein [Polynucleobacter sp. AP-Nino-20-G2]QWE16223.1 tripartite tricarboxylate transporter substrate binding protein [Polynucleobacter sp. AP-Nino-20-G2]
MKYKTAVIAFLGAMGLATFAAAQTFPERPIKLIVPYAPGGSADITARMISEDWGKTLGQPMIVENRAGAGGNAGVDAVAKSKPDGYTIGIHTLSLAVNPALYPKMPFDTLKDLSPIGMVASSQHVLVVNPKVPAQNLKELLALLKKNPGKLTYGSAGNGSTMHIAPELFKATSNTFITHIPYRGGGPALSDTAGGQVDMSFPVASAAAQFVQSGMLRAIGVTGTKRSSLMPNVPTLAEAGLPAYSFETWFIVFAPAGTTQPVVDKLNATLNTTLGNATLKARMTKEGFDPIPSTPAQARQRLEKEIPVWARLIKERGIASD